MIRDNYGRPVINFRVAVTSRCNLKCRYCHREGEVSPASEMSLDEILKITSIALHLGISKVKLTGGEPLLRHDILEIVKGIADFEQVRDLSMVTNGTLLAPIAEALKKEGLDRVNVNLPTLKPETYRWLTGGSLTDTIGGIEAAVKVGLHPVKLNLLVLKGVNEEEIPSMIKFAGRNRAILQIIELEPVNIDHSFYSLYHQALDSIEEDLLKQAIRTRIRRTMQNRKVYSLLETDVEVIQPAENTEFCRHCTRIRATSDGKLKPCLMRNDNLFDIVAALRNGADDETLTEVFIEAIKRREPYFKECVELLTA